MRTFSLFEAVSARATAERIEIRDLGQALHIPDVGQKSVRVQTKVHGMHQWCRITERIVLDRQLRDAEVWAGFERMSRLTPVLPRYRPLAQITRMLTVYGVPDQTVFLPGARLVELDARMQLSFEWFLVVRSSDHQTVIVAQDIDGFGVDNPSNRRFRAVASHHPVLVAAAAEALASFA